jgi:hypothetical protein
VVIDRHFVGICRPGRKPNRKFLENRSESMAHSRLTEVPEWTRLSTSMGETVERLDASSEYQFREGFKLRFGHLSRVGVKKLDATAIEDGVSGNDLSRDETGSGRGNLTVQELSRWDARQGWGSASKSLGRFGPRVLLPKF